jgi:hypothetical protein
MREIPFSPKLRQFMPLASGWRSEDEGSQYADGQWPRESLCGEGCAGGQSLQEWQCAGAQSPCGEEWPDAESPVEWRDADSPDGSQCAQGSSGGRWQSLDGQSQLGLLLQPHDHLQDAEMGAHLEDDVWAEQQMTLRVDALLQVPASQSVDEESLDEQ